MLIPSLTLCLAAFLLVSLPAEPVATDDLSALAEDLRTQLGVPAIAVGITSSQGPTRLGVAGTRRVDGTDPARLEDRFHVGSLTKSMTATVAARLVERGLITWDTTVAQVDPELAAKLPESARTITLSQLLAHRAGLPDDRNPGPTHMRLWMLEGPILEQRREATRLLLSNPANTPADERMNYSNGGYVVAGWMLESITGEAWETLLERELLEPLAMHTTGQGPPGLEPADPNQPLGHGRQGDQLTPVPIALGADNPPVLGPGARVHGSIADLTTYARLHLLGLRGQQEEYLPQAAFVHLHADPESDGYALGWGIQGQGAGRRSLHTGSNSRWYAVMLVWPDRDLAVVAAMNAFPKQDSSVDLLASLIEAATPAPGPVPTTGQTP